MVVTNPLNTNEPNGTQSQDIGLNDQTPSTQNQYTNGADYVDQVPSSQNPAVSPTLPNTAQIPQVPSSPTTPPAQEVAKPLNQQEVQQLQGAFIKGKTQGMQGEDIAKKVMDSPDLAARVDATKQIVRQNRAAATQESSALLTQTPQLVNDRPGFNAAVGYDNLPQDEKAAVDAQFNGAKQQNSNVDNIFAGLMQGVDNNIGTPAYTEAKKRKTAYDMLIGAKPQQVADMIKSGRMLMGSQSLRDLQQFNPQQYSQIVAAVDASSNVQYANDLGKNMYNNLTKAMGDKLPKGVVKQEEVKKEKAPDLVAQVDQSISDSLKAQLGDKAESFLTDVLEETTKPEIMQQREKLNKIVGEANKINEQIATVGDDARRVLGSTAPESLISAYISEKTKNLQNQLRTVNNQAMLEQSMLTSMTEEATKRIDLISRAFDIQQQEDKFAFDRQNTQFGQQMDMQRFGLDQQKFNLDREQVMAKLQPGQAGDFWNTAKITDNGFKSQDGGRYTGIDFAAPKNTPIPAPVGGTITDVGQDGTGNIYVKLLGEDGNTYRFDHQSEDVLGIADQLKGNVVNAGDPIGLVGNSGNIMTAEGDWIRKDGKVIRPDLLDSRGFHSSVVITDSEGKPVTDPATVKSLLQEGGKYNNVAALFSTAKKLMETGSFEPKDLEAMGLDPRKFTQKASDIYTKGMSSQLQSVGAEIKDKDAFIASDKKIKTDIIDGLTNYNAMLNNVDKYRELYDSYGSELLPYTEGNQLLSNALNSIVLPLKEAQNLGVLNGNDYEVLLSQIPSATGFGATVTSRATFMKLLDKFESSLKDKMQQRLNQVGVQYKGTPSPSYQAVGGQAVQSSGNDPLGLGL